MSMQESLQLLGETTERAAKSVVEQYRAGALSFEDMKVILRTLVELGTEQGRALGEASYIAHRLYEDADPTPVAAEYHEHFAAPADRLEKAVETILDGDPEVWATRLGRLAFSEPVEAGQRGLQQAMQEDRPKGGWSRGLEPSACELCRWWWREGRVFPNSHQMPTHKGCTCTPIPRPNVIPKPMGRTE